MAQLSRRAGFSGPTLVRLLARLTDADIPESRLPLSDRLSQWLGWTDAIALAATLDGNTPVVPANTRTFDDEQGRECARVRSALADAIVRDTAANPPPLRNARNKAPAEPTEPDYGTYRQRCLSLQHTMETNIGNLRSRLRGMLAGKTQRATRLAVLDAIMDRALIPRERSLLGTVPFMLQGRFERLRAAARTERAEAAAQGLPVPALDAWLPAFLSDMRNVLLAELDLRMQPVEGLIATLRASADVQTLNKKT
ncbi:hypothetical protein CEG14_21915 [Bordetella genomosp. 1]|uniref:DUF3348 domain-containing protein n=1 Tax=Bordetella genomosp. 1 TaxID=1395607 RepID=A0A261RW41_9BORD|nr:DUF3348 domain-containing protein [Bordetella genomosp. 1]MDQ8031669.1 DUF3348 domain-containing protein [Bordetella sp.]OZI29278.1 hypothetical protein CEG14_21915 [Bordetella genomosp. 1]OZI64990.1 hypothetical protein CAL27_07885 [Bordetella genomosp. 1]